MSFDHDVIICGGGPAGATAARVLAEAGISAMVVDKAEFPRPKLCGGLISEKTVKLVARVHGQSLDDLKRAGAIKARHTRYRITHRRRVLCRGELPYPFNLVRRETLDHHLLGLAARAGAELRTGCRVSACDPKQGTVALEDGTRLKARVIIGADGVSSRVRKSIPMVPARREAWRAGLATGFEIFVPKDRFKTTPDRPELTLGVVRYGYGWAFPVGDEVAVGVCGLYRANRVGFKTLLAEYLDILGVRDPDRVELRSHPIPYGNFLDQPACKRVLLAGDAAGMVEPLLGEGIYYAMRTGELAGRAALAGLESNAEPGPAYMAMLSGEVGRELSWSLKLRNLLFGSEKIHPLLFYRLFLGLFEKAMLQTIHGRRSFCLFAKRRD